MSFCSVVRVSVRVVARAERTKCGVCKCSNINVRTSPVPLCSGTGWMSFSTGGGELYMCVAKPFHMMSADPWPGGSLT